MNLLKRVADKFLCAGSPLKNRLYSFFSVRAVTQAIFAEAAVNPYHVPASSRPWNDLKSSVAGQAV